MNRIIQFGMIIAMGYVHAVACATSTCAVVDLRCEGLVNPLGVDTATPRLSWRMEARDQRSEVSGQRQTAYRVLCATSPGLLKEGSADLWDSGRVESDQSQYVTYGGKKLERGVPCHWSVRIWPALHSLGDGGDEAGEASSWGEPGVWTLFDMTSDASWKAKWMTQGYEGSAVPWMRRSFQLDAAPARAYIYVNAIGYFQLFINGQRVGNDEFAPHVGQYDKRTFCLTYDVAKMLTTGKNTIGFWMGSAWNRIGAGVSMTPTVRAQLEIVDAQGKAITINTDENWRVKPSSMSYLGAWRGKNYGGEVYDARLDDPDWANPDYDDSAWSPAAPGKVSTSVVSAEMIPRNRIIETITPVSVKKLEQKQTAAASKNPVAGTSWSVDMGKAMTGTFEITLPSGPAGHEVVLEFFDRLPDDWSNHGQKSTYIYRGNGVERFNNRFNYASFQYVRITNVPEGEITPADIKGFLITTDLPKASTFSCSDETLNKIHAMMEHTLRCLMLGGYQVDCHSRERQGYGGDGQSSLDTTLCLLRADAFYRKWMRDWVDQQTPDGGLTYTAPASGNGGGPFWCGFLTASTLKHYQHFGDLSLVQKNYPAIKKWFELAQSKTVDDQQQKFCGSWYLGDWVSPRGVDDTANADLFIQAYMCYALEQAAQLADALGKTDDASTFRRWAEARRKATQKRYYDAQGKKYGSGDQVTYILPLAGGVVPDELKNDVFAGFEKTLREKNQGHLATGLSGTYMMIQYLQSIGRDDLIYLFASKTTSPSWGYMIARGATATWERWNGNQSRIHNCYNNIGSWFIQGPAGIRPDTAKPGFKNAIIKPAILKELSYVTATHDTLYGTIKSSWKRDGDTVTMTVSIPANSTATIYVPATDVKQVTVNGKTANAAQYVKVLQAEDRQVLLQVESGNYVILSKE
jgi:alpha-L-rhamnosidase